MPSSDEIHAKVTKVLVQALGAEEDEITPTTTLQGDLGAESIDFLDIVFRLEREFMIKIDRDELFPELLLQGESTIIDGGRLTDDGLAALQTQLPYADWKRLERDRRLDRIDDLFTVDLVTTYVRWKLVGSGADKTDARALAHHESHKTMKALAVSSGSSAA
jgi:acyl carrier protein